MTIIVNTNPSKYRESTADELIDQPVEAGDYFGTTSANGGQVWYFDGTIAVRVGIPNPDHRSMVSVEEGESLRDALNRIPMFDEKAFVIHRMALPPGAYYPRIARPNDQHALEAPGYCNELRSNSYEMISSLSQLRSLVAMLDDVFQTVHPTMANLDCFGSGIRNLILLACTECEAQWRAVLKANDYTARGKSGRLTTEDYVKLLPAMRLDEYRVSFSHYPWLQTIAPFEGWDPSRPTRSLDWYDGYNAVKHDREVAFAHASLRNAIKSVAATWVMIAAQFGFTGMREFDDLWRYFHLDRVPRWRYSDVYTLGTYDGHKASVGPHNYLF